MAAIGSAKFIVDVCILSFRFGANYGSERAMNATDSFSKDPKPAHFRAGFFMSTPEHIPMPLFDAGQPSVMNSTQFAQAKAEVITGGALMTAPFWGVFLQDVSAFASAVAAVCGMIVGLHAVWRLRRRERARLPDADED